MQRVMIQLLLKSAVR